MITTVNGLSSINAYNNIKSNNNINTTSSDYSFSKPLQCDTISFKGVLKTSEISDETIKLLKEFIEPLVPNFKYKFNIPTVQRLSVVHLVPPNGASEKIHFNCISRELSSAEKYADFIVDLGTKKIFESGRQIKDAKLITEYEKGIPELLSAAKRHEEYPKV